MDPAQRKRFDQVRYFRALEARYLALAYLTNHKSQAAFYAAIARQYAAIADTAAEAERKTTVEVVPAPAPTTVSAVFAVA
jgi:hypothetical protein